MSLPSALSGDRRKRIKTYALSTENAVVQETKAKTLEWAIIFRFVSVVEITTGDFINAFVAGFSV